MTQTDFNKKLLAHCGFDETHMIYKLHSTDFSLPSDLIFEDAIVDKTDIQESRNKLTVVKSIGPDSYITRLNREYSYDMEFVNVENQIITTATNEDHNVSLLLVGAVCVATFGAFLSIYVCCKPLFETELKGKAVSEYEQII